MIFAHASHVRMREWVIDCIEMLYHERDKVPMQEERFLIFDLLHDAVPPHSSSPPELVRVQHNADAEAKK